MSSRVVPRVDLLSPARAPRRAPDLLPEAAPGRVPGPTSDQAPTPVRPIGGSVAVPEVRRRATDPVPRRTSTLAVVIPMFRESARIGATLQALDRSTLNRPGVQLVMVDDGSDDDTVGAVFRELAGTSLADPVVVQFPANRGKGAAVRAGMLAADADVVAFVDADLSMDPYVVDLALDLLRTSGADVVVGHRVVDRSEQPRLRRLSSVVFKRLVSALVPTGASDPQCACKVFTRQAARTVFEAMETDGFAFDVEVLLRVRRSGLRLEEMPVAWTHQAGSTLNPVLEPLRMMRDVVRVRRTLRRSS